MPDGLAASMKQRGCDATAQSETGWAGLKNGVLSQKIAASNFSVFITKDRNFHHQGGLLIKRPEVTIVLLDAVTLHQAARAVFIARFLNALDSEGLPLEPGLHLWPKNNFNK